MGMKGLTLYHLKSHLQQVKKETAPGDSKGGKHPIWELPIAEALRYQIEVQRKLHEQLEVQKKLQMRIEAQGKYLQAILEKAQKSLSFGGGSLDEARAQLADFNLTLSGLVENAEERTAGGAETAAGAAVDSIRVSQTSAFQLYKGEEERREAEVVPNGDLLLLDLNLKGSYERLGG
ncbi:unnamed protein product [Spirodela intermedia]|uniref:MYB-CC type transcription factor LHEQLE-containing domain-containing protein n=1 Tax=Spirodela intermedia TaxID=51605 RepID=A0A7I8JIG7_SPIIN|nr:unnamed protein product [Spirodela intermedia]CAA6669545.1 unnamed protein product [Spirodela intermedia]